MRKIIKQTSHKKALSDFSNTNLRSFAQILTYFEITNILYIKVCFIHNVFKIVLYNKKPFTPLFGG